MGYGSNADIKSFVEQMEKLYGNNVQVPKSEFEIDAPKAEIESSTGYQVPIKSSFYSSGGFDPTGKGNVGRIHQGVDLRAPGGTSIYPIAPGVVTEVRPDPKGGNPVNVKHSGGLTSYYAHMGTISVLKGDSVGLNTVLGTVGASGNAQGFPHLHLQVWKNGTLTDPATVISVPKYTPFDNKKEKLWLSDDAKAVAFNWNLQQHISAKRQARYNLDELVALADYYYQALK